MTTFYIRKDRLHELCTWALDALNGILAFAGTILPMKNGQGQCLTRYPQYPRFSFYTGSLLYPIRSEKATMTYLLRGTAFITGAGSGRTAAPRESTSKAEIKYRHRSRRGS